MNKVEYRKNIYGLFEKLAGRKMTDGEHADLKSVILSYVEDTNKELTKLNNLVADRNKKAKEMAKIIYHKGWDAEILEKHIGFLKKFFEEK